MYKSNIIQKEKEKKNQIPWFMRCEILDHLVYIQLVIILFPLWIVPNCQSFLFFRFGHLGIRAIWPFQELNRKHINVIDIILNWWIHQLSWSVKCSKINGIIFKIFFLLEIYKCFERNVPLEKISVNGENKIRRKWVR